MLSFHWLKSRRTFPEAAGPDMRVRDLAQAPDNDPVLRCTIQLCYEHFAAAEQQALDPSQPDSARCHAAGQAFGLSQLIRSIETIRAQGRNPHSDPAKKLKA